MAGAAEPNRRQSKGGRQLLSAVALLLAASALAAQEFKIWPSADYTDAPAVAFNRIDDNWIVLAHHDGPLSMRRVGWNAVDGTWVGKIRTLEDGWASSYAIAHNWEANNYLAVWSSGYDVRVARVNHRAQRLDDPIVLYSSASEILAVDVVFLGVESNHWLVVWQKWVSGGPDQLLMQVVKADGTLEGPIFDIGSRTWGPWSVACNTTYGRLMMVWQGDSSLLGQFFLPDGTLESDLLTIGSGSAPAILYARQPKRWLIAWHDGSGLEGRMVASGVLQPTITITEIAYDHYPGIAWDLQQARFLVAWVDYPDTAQIFAQRLRGSGALDSGPHLVSTAQEWKRNRNEEYLDCSTLEGRCLVTWSQGYYEIWGRFVTGVGGLLTVSKSGAGSGTVTSSPSGIYCGSECSQHYLSDQTVELDAIADSGSLFTGWSGDADCADGVVTMSADRSCTASFGIDPSCPDAWEPDDSAAQASAIASGVAQTHSICPIGDEDWAAFTLAAESAVELETSGPWGDTRMWLYDSGQSFIEYDDDGGAGLFSFIDRTCVLDPLPPGTYYVQIDEYGDNGAIDEYDLTYSLVELCPPTLDIVKAGSGDGEVSSVPAGIDCGATCAAQFPHGTPVTLTAAAATGSAFAHWGGACSGLAPTCSLNLTMDATAQATFVPPACVVTVADHAVTGPELYESCYMVAVGPAVTVENGGDLETRAAEMVLWQDGLSVLAGGSASAILDPLLASP